MQNVSRLLDAINLPKQIATHVVGKNHNEKHHLIASVPTIFFGSFLFNMHLLFHIDLIIGIIIHTLAAYFHTVGFVPVLDLALKNNYNKSQQTSNDEPTNNDITGNP